MLIHYLKISEGVVLVTRWNDVETAAQTEDELKFVQTPTDVALPSHAPNFEQTFDVENQSKTALKHPKVKAFTPNKNMWSTSM